MKFFEALNLLKPNTDYKVFGFDHLGFGKEIWAGSDFDQAKKIAWDAKDKFHDTVIKYKGTSIPKAGALKIPFSR